MQEEDLVQLTDVNACAINRCPEKNLGIFVKLFGDALWPREIITQVLRGTCEILIRMSWTDVATVKQNLTLLSHRKCVYWTCRDLKDNWNKKSFTACHLN